MLQKVSLGRGQLDTYRRVVGDALIDEIRELGKELSGARICHINSTSLGGGVAELLHSAVPLVRDAGVVADWQVIDGTAQFFSVTKGLHNALQGGTDGLLRLPEMRELYRETNRANALQLNHQDYDLIIVHDPQPAALRSYLENSSTRWVWRCHVESFHPEQEPWEAFLRPYVEQYDAAIFTMEGFVPAGGLTRPFLRFIPPAIDAFSTKNIRMPSSVWREFLEGMGVSKDRPLITQVARFDYWKDPVGVIEAYRLAKEQVPGLQLALLGSLANDDPEGWSIYTEVHDLAAQDPDIHVLSNLTGAGNLEVNLFQTASDVVVQKSLKEGFGLVISESLWKGTPVVAGKTGGIPMQMSGPLQDYLVSGIEECAEKTVHLLQHPDEAHELGAWGRQHIRENFLMPRLVRDELALVKDVLALPVPAPPSS